MQYQNYSEELKKIILPFLEQEEIGLVDLQFTKQGRDALLRLFVDRASGGITLEECSHLNREIGNLLDLHDIIKTKYILEVSSPGLDRPLKGRSDFLRAKDKFLRFFLSEPIEGKIELEAQVKEVNAESVTVEVEGKTFSLYLPKINRAKYIV
jgi:ribosome maturation factor RimP